LKFKSVINIDLTRDPMSLSRALASSLPQMALVAGTAVIEAANGIPVQNLQIQADHILSKTILGLSSHQRKESIFLYCLKTL
jgi:hypothetical protein